MAVREDTSGPAGREGRDHLRPAQPAGIRPKRERWSEPTATRDAMPAEVPIENVAFEGFMVHRRVIDAIGLPDPGFFIFYDDVDYAVRARRAGFPIVAVRDAVLVRQLDFDQQHDMRSWKGFNMYRNLFVVHLRYGENALVRNKPYLIALVALVLAVVRGRRDEAGNVRRALRDARAGARMPDPLG